MLICRRGPRCYTVFMLRFSRKNLIPGLTSLSDNFLLQHAFLGSDPSDDN